MRNRIIQTRKLNYKIRKFIIKKRKRKYLEKFRLKKYVRRNCLRIEIKI